MAAVNKDLLLDRFELHLDTALLVNLCDSDRKGKEFLKDGKLIT